MGVLGEVVVFVLMRGEGDERKKEKEEEKKEGRGGRSSKRSRRFPLFLKFCSFFLRIRSPNFLPSPSHLRVLVGHTRAEGLHDGH